MSLAWIDQALDITEADLQSLMAQQPASGCGSAQPDASSDDLLLLEEDPLLAVLCEEHGYWEDSCLDGPPPLAAAAPAPPPQGAHSASGDTQAPWPGQLVCFDLSSAPAGGAAAPAHMQSVCDDDLSSELAGGGGAAAAAAGSHRQARMREPTALVMLPWQAATALIAGASVAAAASMRTRAAPGRSASGLLAGTAPAQLMGQPGLMAQQMKRSASVPAELDAFASCKAPRLVAVAADAAARCSQAQRGSMRAAIENCEMQCAAVRKERQRRAAHARLALLRLHPKHADQQGSTCSP